MTPSKIVCILIAFSLLVCAVSCKEPMDNEQPGDFEASVSVLSETMKVDRDDAIGILEVLCSLGLDARIDSIYAASDDEGTSFYKVWFGLNLLHVYIQDGEVAKVLRYGEIIYPKSSEGGEKPENPSDDPTPTPTEIELVSMTSKLRAGDEARIEVIGAPDTVYEITVRYSSGASSAKGLEPKLSDSDGRVAWSWKVSANVLPGEYSIEITSGGTSYKTTFTVE